MPDPKPFRRLIVGCLVLLLAGCQSNMGGAVQMLRDAVWGKPPPQSAALDPAFRYLRVTAGRQVVFMALGYVDPHPQGPVEVWYSAEREVLRLQHGRLVGAAGTRTEWRAVRLPVLPSWRALAERGAPLAWVRTRDVMPGYRFNVRDDLLLQPIAPPARSALQGIAPASLQWFEETLAADAALALPPARYAIDPAVDDGQVVYAEQCLAVDLCLTWQRWRAGQ
jgi:hypothetical protein